jgi:hypothetical protein
MTLNIERVANGYIIRDDTEDETFVVSEDNEIAVVWAKLAENDDADSLPSNRDTAKRLRAIVDAFTGPATRTTVAGKELAPAEDADWHLRGWTADELGSVYAVNDGRYVVSLIVTYDDSKWSDRRAGIENIHSPATAAAAALDLTRDTASRGTIWYVFDRLTQQMHTLAQGEFERE